MRYKAVGFDYGGVIGGVGSIGVNFTRRISELLGVSEETYKEAYFSLNHKINTGEIANWREFWQLFLEKFGQPEKLGAVMALSEEATAHWGDMDKDMLRLIDELRQKGYKTGLLSNATTDNGAKMRAAGLDEHFDVFHISADIKLMKPNPKTFEGFVRELQVLPHELIFVDDSEKSLSTAEECGFTPLLFTDYGGLVVDLKKLGVL